MTERIPIILDVDTGIDDAAAISLAVHSPDAELLSVSTVAGNTTIENATRNTLDVLDLLGATERPRLSGRLSPAGARALHGRVRAWQQRRWRGRAAAQRRARSGRSRARRPSSAHAQSRPGEITLDLSWAADEPRHRAECGAGAAEAAQAVGHHGRRILEPGQHHAASTCRIQYLRRSRRPRSRSSARDSPSSMRSVSMSHMRRRFPRSSGIWLHAPILPRRRSFRRCTARAIENPENGTAVHSRRYGRGGGARSIVYRLGTPRHRGAAGRCPSRANSARAGRCSVCFQVGRCTDVYGAVLPAARHWERPS